MICDSPGIHNDKVLKDFFIWRRIAKTIWPGTFEFATLYVCLVSLICRCFFDLSSIQSENVKCSAREDSDVTNLARFTPHYDENAVSSLQRTAANKLEGRPWTTGWFNRPNLIILSPRESWLDDSSLIIHTFEGRVLWIFRRAIRGKRAEWLSPATWIFGNVARAFFLIKQRRNSLAKRSI